jgi:hypothetical protein
MKCDNERWKVEVGRVGEHIHVYPSNGYTTCYGAFVPNTYVSAPNIIERLIGITFTDKIAKAKERCRVWCERENALEDEARKYVP